MVTWQILVHGEQGDVCLETEFLIGTSAASGRKRGGEAEGRIWLCSEMRMRKAPVRALSASRLR